MTLPSNFIATPYRGVSVQVWPRALRARQVREALLGREAYRRTEFIVLRHGDDSALVRISKSSDEPLLSPITNVEWLAGPDECVYVEAPETDVGNATALAGVTSTCRSDARAYIVEGQYHHVNFIWEPRPLRVRVVEVIPPEPPKLLEMARRVVEFDEDLPPIELQFEPIDIREIARARVSERYLLPCRGSGIDLPGPVDFLDGRPSEQTWTMIGCERSRQFFEWFYGHQPVQEDICPRNLAPAGGASLIKCCLLERGIEREDERLVVPWGANLDEVRRALHLLAGTAQEEHTATGTPSIARPPQVG